MLKPLLILAVVFSCATSHAADSEARPWMALENCVKDKARVVINAPATATEIALASLYRCKKEANDYWADFYLSMGRNTAAGERADMELESKENELMRMVISDVIDARMQEKGDN